MIDNTNEKWDELSGGREGAIFKNENAVHRPWNPWSPTVHAFLNHLHSRGVDFCPRFLGQDSQGNEIVSYIEGAVYNYPLVGNITSEAVLQEAAQKLRIIHDASLGFIESIDAAASKWMLSPRTPAEVICHGDYAPYNFVLKGCQVSGIIDFDTIHPGPRIWDIAYAVYTWAPFKTGEYDKMGSLEEQIHRARLFCDAYGLSQDKRHQLVPMMIERLETVLQFMLTEAENGNEAFIANIRDRHHLGYMQDIEYIQQHGKKIASGVMT